MERATGVPVTVVARVRPVVATDTPLGAAGPGAGPDAAVRRVVLDADGKSIRLGAVPNRSDSSSGNGGGSGSGGSGDVYAFSAAYGPTASTTDLFATDVLPLVKAAVQGVNVAVCVLGASGSGRAHTLHGRTGAAAAAAAAASTDGKAAASMAVPTGSSDGVMDLAGDTLFTFLNQKLTPKPDAAPSAAAAAGGAAAAAAAAANRYDNRKNSYTVTCSYVEVYDDAFHDLLQSSAAHSGVIGGAGYGGVGAGVGPKLALDFGADGAFVRGLTRRPVAHAEQLRNLLRSARTTQRLAARAPHSPLRALAAELCWLDVEQRLAPTFSPVRSRLWFVLLPATDRLAGAAAAMALAGGHAHHSSSGSTQAAVQSELNALRAREGARVTRELVGTANLLRRLAAAAVASAAASAAAAVAPGAGAGGAMAGGGGASTTAAAAVAADVSVDYSECKTTSCLEDVFGGNCQTLLIATLSPFDTPVPLLNSTAAAAAAAAAAATAAAAAAGSNNSSSNSGAVAAQFSSSARATLEYAGCAARIANFPVRNDERSVGALRRLRTRIAELRLQLRMERLDGRGGGGGGTGPAAAAGADATGDTGAGGLDSDGKDGVILELKAALLASEQKLSQLERDRGVLYDRYTAFRAQYSALVAAKAKLTSDWLRSEQQRLRLAKLLIDVQIECTDVREQSARDKYELESRLMGVEQSAVEHNAAASQHAARLAQLTEELARVTTDKQELSSEYVSLRESYRAVVAELDTSRAKTDALSAELLTLINQNGAMEAAADQLAAQHAALQQQTDLLAAKKQALDELNAKYEAVKRDYQQLSASANASSSTTPGGSTDTAHAHAQQQLAALQRAVRDLNDQCTALQRENHALKHSGLSADAVSAMKAEYERAQHETRATVQHLRDALADLRDARPSASRATTATAGAAGAGAGAGAGGAAVQSELNEYQRATQKRLEAERADLRTRLTAAEQELSAFQSYMRTQAAAYQKEIARLQRDVSAWKRVAEHNAAGAGMALPPPPSAAVTAAAAAAAAAAASVHKPVSAAPDTVVAAPPKSVSPEPDAVSHAVPAPSSASASASKRAPSTATNHHHHGKPPQHSPPPALHQLSPSHRQQQPSQRPASQQQPHKHTPQQQQQRPTATTPTAASSRRTTDANGSRPATTSSTSGAHGLSASASSPALGKPGTSHAGTRAPAAAASAAHPLTAQAQAQAAAQHARSRSDLKVQNLLATAGASVVAPKAASHASDSRPPTSPQHQHSSQYQQLLDLQRQLAQATQQQQQQQQQSVVRGGGGGRGGTAGASTRGGAGDDSLSAFAASASLTTSSSAGFGTPKAGRAAS